MLKNNKPLTCGLLGSLIEGLAYWAVHENVQDTEELIQALEHFVSHGLEQTT